jgi:rubrerythrin
MFPKSRNIPMREFVRLLQFAYSGELGAAIAYAGHATAVADPAERQRIRQIRRDELEHRTSLGRMLYELGAAPDRLLELRNRWLGSGIARFCHIGGWFLPMYGAGWLERRNILDYERAARLSVRCGQPRFADALLSMAEAEWEHERYFRLKTSSHPLAVIVRVWTAPPCKEEIRCSFDRFLQESSPALPLRCRGAMAGAST